MKSTKNLFLLIVFVIAGIQISNNAHAQDGVPPKFPLS